MTAARIRQRMREIATGGAASIAVNVAVTNVIRLGSSVTLTHLLDRSAYGVVGIITSVSYMLTMLSDVGLYDFIVRHHEGDRRDFLDQVWTLRLIRGVALALLMVAIAGPVSHFLDKPQLTLVIMVWSVDFVIDGLSSLAFATAVRSQSLWRLSNMDLAGNVVTTLTSITMAAILHSYWAMIIGMVTGQMLRLVLSYAVFPDTRRRWNFNFTRSRELWSFSRYIMMSSMLTLAIAQSDKLVLAKIMSLADYGLYAIAVGLAMAPGALAVPYATRILLNTYSRVAREDRPALRDVLYAERRKVTFAYMAATGAMMAAAPLIVRILYPHAYQGVAPFLQLLLISAVLRMPGLSAKQALIAIGRTGAQLIGNIGCVLWLAAGGVIGLLTHNIMLLVAVVGTVEVPNLVCFLWSLRRDHLLKPREEVLGLVVAVIGGGVGWVMNLGGLAVLNAIGWHS